MDSVNLSGTLLSVAEVVVPNGSSEVYAVVLELNSGFAQDISVVKHSLIGTSGISETAHLNSLMLYPNPATNRLNIITKQRVAMVEVYNLHGQLQMVSKSPEIDITSLGVGVYFVKAYSAEGYSTQKFVKE